MLTKKINGVEEVCTDEDEAIIRSEWAENDRDQAPQEISDAKDAIVNAEFTPALLAIVKILDTTNADTIITAAKALRKQEL